MPKYLADLEFTSGESLYRRLTRTMFDGEEVLASAISLEGCSVNRSSLSTPESTLDSGSDKDVAVGVAVADSIPDQFSSPVSDDTYESFIEHVPENGNDAHCHIKVQKAGFEAGAAWNKRKPKSKVFRRRIKEDIAEQFAVTLKVPTV